ncbi:copper resistance protein CopC [Frankia sp. AgB1.9]|uniref:copper resistance CopC family protein n=1 Tax=unclassified Frankia TaxID=2632575 RepID=UPI0019332AC7|nr:MULTISPECIES: copper resistance CopC family protein [unclassified Frankia]MBL7491072.1 copper resistance protein CopC [Frankia sp. AgW1.1]MBL7553120.1 copper resistance protein CopC [Frankia sp. AgB1.9]MBL7623035.1 copper resistance protein CopC [Frankia sp. AgB1.8]
MRAPKDGSDRAGRGPVGRRVGAGLAGLGLALVALVAVAAPASAHTRLLSSTPADGSTVPTAPDQIRLTFAQHLLGLGAVAVEGPGGSSVGVGDAVLDGAIVTLRLAEHRPAGVYRLSYRIVSADGHPVSGQVTFTATGDVGSVSSPTAAAATPSAAGASASGGTALPGTTLPGTGATSEGKGGSSAGLVVGIAAGVGALVVVSGAVIALRARRGQGGTDGA